MKSSSPHKDPRTSLRRVEYKEDWYYFHQWGVFGNISTAILESRKGEVFEVNPNQITFIDVEITEDE